MRSLFFQYTRYFRQNGTEFLIGAAYVDTGSGSIVSAAVTSERLFELTVNSRKKSPFIFTLKRYSVILYSSFLRLLRRMASETSS